MGAPYKNIIKRKEVFLHYPVNFLRRRERIRAWLLGREFYKAVEGLEFAAKYHVGVRKDGFTPEFHHQVSIANYVRTLPNLRFPELTLLACFLHDLLEDNEIDPDVLAVKFGRDTATAIIILSKKMKGKEGKKSAEEYYGMIATSPVASIVKGGDRIHNFQTCPGVFSCEKQQAYIKECEDFIIPALTEARNNFPDQELAYENIKHVLRSQIELLKLSIEAKLAANIEK